VIDVTGSAPRDRVAGLWHSGLTVRDLEASLAYYCDGLGLEHLFTRDVDPRLGAEIWGCPDPVARVAFLRVPGSDTQLELFEFDHGETPAPPPLQPWETRHTHVCFYVDDLDGLYERMSAQGHRFRSPGPVPITTGPLAGARALYAVDPDGVSVELFERPPA
jgi:lactoylglutathione lyase